MNRLKRNIPALFIALAIFVGASTTFHPRIARADVPVATVTGTLTNPGDQVIVIGLVGQSSCSFFATGSPSAVDVQGTNDKSGSPGWTNVAALDYGSPAAVQTQPFTPSTGTSYQFSPTSLTRARVVADATWSGGPASITITCTAAVARAGAAGGGGGGVTTVSGSGPVTATGSSAVTVGFDYSFSGLFTSDQSIGTGTVGCSSGSANPAWLFADPEDQATGFIVQDPGGAFEFGQGQVFHGSCSHNVAFQISPNGIIPGQFVDFTVPNLGVRLLNYTNGCVYVQGGILTTTNDGSVCATGGTAIGGANITVLATASPAGGQIISLIPQPVVSNIDFTDTALQAPGDYMGLTADGAGKVKVVAIAVSPCPTTGCGVQGVAATLPLSSSGGLIPNISIATAIPRTVGGFGSDTSGFPDGDCILTFGSGTLFTPAPCATPSTPNTVTVTSPLALSTAVPHVFALSLLTVPPVLGGFGADASGYANGTCPAFNTGLGHFVSAPCSSATSAPVTGGTNITVASNVVSTVSAPTFSASVTSPILQTGVCGSCLKLFALTGSAGQILFGPGLTDSDAGSSTITGTTNPNASCGSTTCELLFGVGLTSNLLIQTRNSPGLRMDSGSTGLGFSCFFGQGAVSTGPNFTCQQRFNTDGTSSFPGVTTMQGTVVSPKKGNATCSLSAATTCTATATVIAGTTCVASYDHATTVTLAVLAPLTQSVASTTLSMFAQTTVAQTGTVSVDYICI